MQNWYESWFSSTDYLLVYRHRNDLEAETLSSLLVKILPSANNSKILDLGCGAGRHSISMARRGFNVTGVDLSLQLINIARKNAFETGVNAKFINEDYRQLNLPECFDVALNLFTSFGYFPDDDENFSVFNTAYRHLCKGGFFVFDYFNQACLRKSLLPFSRQITDGAFIEQFRWIEGAFVKKRIVLQNGSSLKLHLESVKMYYPDEISDALRERGFSIIAMYGDYSGSDFDPIHSPRLIMICQKN